MPAHDAGRHTPPRRLHWRSAIILPALLLGLLSGAPAMASAPAVGPDGVAAAGAGLLDPRIVGGTPVPNGKYPFQAALLAQSFGDDDWQRQFCGGSLISVQQVLTAAHCVDFIGSDEDDSVLLSDLRVVVGRTVLTSTQGQKRRAVQIDIHPRWDPESFRFDVAVITLVRPIEGIDPVQLVSPGTDALERPGSRVIATGWGNVKAQPVGPGAGGVRYPTRLREVSLPLLSSAECANASTVDGTNYFHKRSMLCAGKTGKDTCQGDSGGPLFVEAVTGGYIQLGITSWGFGCAATGYPGVYARLSNRSIGNFILLVTGGVPV